MGCCSSRPQEEDTNTTFTRRQTQTRQAQQIVTPISQKNCSLASGHSSFSPQSKAPEVTITRTSESLDSNVEKKLSSPNPHSSNTVDPNINDQSAGQSNQQYTSKNAETSNTTSLVYIRLASNGQDIPIQVPTAPPYLTVAELREKLLQSTTVSSSSTIIDLKKKGLLVANKTVKLIYLGHILTDQYVIIPTTLPEEDQVLPPPNHKSKIVRIQEKGVIQSTA